MVATAYDDMYMTKELSCEKFRHFICIRHLIYIRHPQVAGHLSQKSH